jgi:hypothetical protein
MISKSEVREILGSEWRHAGLKGRGNRWRHAGPDVHWIVQIQGDWLGRLSLVADAAPASAGHVPTSNDAYSLRIFVDNLPGVSELGVIEALTMDSKMADDTRREVLRDVAFEVARFVMAHGTLASLRYAYRSGELEGMSIRKDLRQCLEATE